MKKLKLHYISKSLALTISVLVAGLISGCGEQQVAAQSAEQMQLRNEAALARSAQDHRQAKPFEVVTRVNGKTMGTFYSITVPGGFPGGEEALRNLAEKEFDRISAAISTFDPNAELYKFNALNNTNPYPISTLLSDIIEETVHQAHRVEDVIDITVGPLVNLWGFGKENTSNKTPSTWEIENAKLHIGLDKFEIRHTANGPLLSKRDTAVQLDLSTVGEGIGADAVALELEKLGIHNYLVAVAGANRSRGLNPQGKLWKIGIEDPTTPEHKVFAPVCPLDQGMSTAGSYRNYFKDEKTGKIYSHAIDPKTGYPIDHKTLSVTVIARNTFTTDAIDTGLLIFGADKALKWGEKHDVAIYTIELVDGKPQARYTKAFEPYLRCGEKQD
ncbi:MAG: FAD:protein FMN transferase [Succinivibrio sp.]|nr:FAD:protein FMN transferase [Succinivibrio sp.]